MLSGVRTGKKKKRKRPAAAAAAPAPAPDAPTEPALSTGGRGDGRYSRGDDEGAPPKPKAAAAVGAYVSSACGESANLAAAEELRRSLGLPSGGTGGGGGGFTDCSRKPWNTSGAGGGGGRKSGAEIGSAWADLERRGRIRTLEGALDGAAAAGGHPSTETSSDNDDDAVVLTAAASTSNPLSREDFRSGARRGKVSKHAARTSSSHSAREQTVEEMAADERTSHRTMDESYARNVARLGSRYKGTEFARGSRSGADEEDYTGEEGGGGGDQSMFATSSDRLTGAERAKRERARQVATYDAQSAIASKCWWWTSSPSFKRHTLLALGDHVSMILCPSHLALVENQVILVPLQHGESFRAVDEEVWEEVGRFKASLRNMWRSQGKGVLFMETVLPHKGFWQARMECVPVPKRVEEDAPIYFKSALTEQAEEWGTHTKILSTREKGLRRTVPKNFPYFHVEWFSSAADGHGRPGGYAHILEATDFPRDFGLDTVAGMLGTEPMKFSRRRKATDDAERAGAARFAGMWREFDWTAELDGDGDDAAAPAGGSEVPTGDAGGGGGEGGGSGHVTRR